MVLTEVGLAAPLTPDPDKMTLALSPWLALRSTPMSYPLWRQLCGLYSPQDWPWHAQYVQTQARRCAQALGQTHTDTEGRPAWGCWGGPADQQLALSTPWPGLDEVIGRLQARTAAEPQDWLSWLYLARCLELGQDRSDAAVQARVRAPVLQALGCEWMPGETGHLLAQWRLRSGDPSGALTALQAVLQQAPQRHGSWLLQAQAQMQLGHEDAARASFAKAGESRNPQLLTLLADKLFINNFGVEALQVREVVTQLTPADAQAWLALAELQAKLWQVDLAKTSVDRALALQPGNVQALRWREDLSAAGYSRPQFERELARFEAEGLARNAQGATRLLMQSLYQAHLSADAVAHLHRRIGKDMTEQALASITVNAPQPAPLPWPGSDSPPRRLRVGYVSGDLHRQHPVNVFLLPVLQRHDHAQLEVFVYQTGTMIDEYTRMARACADHWREAAHLDDIALHRLIVDDRIDVLVDLAGHTATHRLGVSAMRAAPVQMSYLGYPHSTGLPCIDWMIADAVVAPPGDERLFTEKVARVSGSVFCWAPVDEYPLPPDAQAVPDRPVVFASFNNLLKVDDATLRVWARILRQAPQSRLLLKSAVLADPVVVQRSLERFAHEGVGADRLELRGPSELSLMMQEYLAVDVALDPFPYNGGTTSLQALWMGCPMVSLQGQNFVSRMGASFLTHLGRSEWLAHSEDDYVAKALALAAEVRQRPWSRHAQRAAMQASDLCNIERHTREMEAIFRQAFLDARSTPTP